MASGRSQFSKLTSTYSGKSRRKKTKDVEKLYPIEERQQGIHNDTKRINKL